MTVITSSYVNKILLGIIGFLLASLLLYQVDYNKDVLLELRNLTSILAEKTTTDALQDQSILDINKRLTKHLEEYEHKN